MSATVAFSPAITPSAYAGPSVRGSEEAAMPAQTGSPASAAAASTDTRTEVAELAAIDARVRAHEAAHRAAAGELARGGSYTYKTGPDGRAYAVAGEVGIDAAVIRGDPAATLAKMLQVERAALAPADPSPQDRRVAALAAGRAAEARAELATAGGATPAASAGASGAAAPAGPAAAGHDGQDSGAAGPSPSLIERALAAYADAARALAGIGAGFHLVA